ncbi:DnaB-like helicase N-terminal domain-containing protein [Kitasatospora griseola]|uniref:DnaB-like helicase N-terminal domain-containing protein n=1 Tax=Kitasatospora griseola TaxID=2064 RepID=UPI00365E59AF
MTIVPSAAAPAAEVGGRGPASHDGTADRAEHALLGAGLLHPQQLRNLRWITPQDFRHPARGWLWRTLHQTPAKDVRPMAITEALAAADPGTRRILSPDQLALMVAECPSPGRAPLYGGMVLEASLHRAVDRAGSDLRTRVAHAGADEAQRMVADALAAGRQLTGMGVRWATVPDPVRVLLETPGDRPPAAAPPLPRSRADRLAEEATVASLLAYPHQIRELGWLASADFTDPGHAVAFRAVERLAQCGAPVDPLTVAWESRRIGAPLDVEVLDRLHQAALPGQAEYAGRTVLANAALNRLDHAGAHVQQLAADSSLSAPALLTASSGAIAPLETTHQRLLEMDTPARAHGAADLSARTRTETEIDL